MFRDTGPEFVEGLAGSANRSQRLGDIGANAPANWRWGVGGREPHILLMLFAKPDSVGALERTTREAAERSGLTIVDVLPTSHMGGVEPFGFVDGVSQPTFDWDRARTPGTKADRAYTNLLALGELLLGDRNEDGFLAETPTLAEGEKTRVSCPRPRIPPGAATSAAMAPISSIANCRRMCEAFGVGRLANWLAPASGRNCSQNWWSAAA